MCLSGRMWPRRPVGTRGGVGRMWGPCACPGRGGLALHIMEPEGITARGGQAQGPYPFPHPPLVPTERDHALLPYSIGKIHQGTIPAFGRLSSFGRFGLWRENCFESESNTTARAG